MMALAGCSTPSDLLSRLTRVPSVYGGDPSLSAKSARQANSPAAQPADRVTLVFQNNAFDSQNLQYALRLHSALVETTGGADRGVRRARFMGVLRAQNRPAVLLEGGYLSNPREAQLIGQPEYRQKLAEAVAKALVVTNNVLVATNAAFDAFHEPQFPNPNDE